MKFFKCEKCDSIYIPLLDGNNNEQKCTHKELNEIIPVKYDKDEHMHIIDLRRIGSLFTIKITGNPHSQTEIHHIKSIVIKTSQGLQTKTIDKNGQVFVDFLVLENEIIEMVYIYCNIHDLLSIEFNK